VKTIPLTQGAVALVDDEDYERVHMYNWHTVRTDNGLYAARRVYLHSFIMDAPFADHVDHNGLNCQKHNLRVGTQQQNMANRAGWGASGYKGVQQYGSKFQARIVVNRQKLHLGMYNTAIEAAVAYDNAAREHFGEFAWTNF
jgi:AP2 domain.